MIRGCEPRPCGWCGTVYTAKASNQQYCTDQCSRERQHQREKLRQQARRRTGLFRRCGQCGVDIDARGYNAVYCLVCTTARHTASKTHRTLGERASSALKRHDRPRQGPVTKKKAARKQTQTTDGRDASPPNLAGPNWWPGWDGCYSPNLNPLQKELLAQGTARFKPSSASHHDSATAFRDRTHYKESA